jgi:GNAT superfamily N-acetyltransferase
MTYDDGVTLRVLGPGDEAKLDDFLRKHADSSMFLRSNARAAGLADEGKPLQGTYAALFDGEAIVAVAAHAWNGFVMVQAPTVGLSDVVRFAVTASKRAVAAFSGPRDQVVAARRALDLESAETSMDAREILFRLELDQLIVPQPIRDGTLRCVLPRPEDRETTINWRAAYCVETLGDRESPALRESCARDIDRITAQGSCFVLLDRSDDPVAFTAFNAELPDCVQIGGVYTPPSLRGRGHARSIVAGQLLIAKRRGVSRSILFTGEENTPAIKAYSSLGYRVVGEYGLVRLREPRPIS